MGGAKHDVVRGVRNLGQAAGLGARSREHAAPRIDALHGGH